MRRKRSRTLDQALARIDAILARLVVALTHACSGART